jgi:uncharacterized protein (DUF1015 family)
MARISPFKALRYNTTKAGDLSKLVTQPYDKIDRPLQDQYYQRHPYNVVRIIKSDEVNSNPETPYPKAAQTLRDWRAQGIFEVEPQPALYIYYQMFTFRGRPYTRKGFVASVELEEKGVRAHEHTLAGPKADRLRLLKATETNDELIFMLFTDPVHEAVKAMDEAIEGQKPVLEAEDDFGERHQVWAVRDEATIQKLQSLVAPVELFIADGHHRYETAVNFKHECEAKGWKPVGAQGFDHRMMALFPMEDPGLVIFPTHRLVHHVKDFDGTKLVNQLKDKFNVQPMTSADDLFRVMDAHPEEHAFGLVVSGKPNSFYFLKLKDISIADKEGPAGASEPSKRLGVTILHHFILDQLLGIDKAKLEAFTNVDYARHREEVMERIAQGGIQCAFLLNGTDVAHVKAVAERGERMPQKSTDFYPKLLAGLVMMPLEIKK